MDLEHLCTQASGVDRTNSDGGSGSKGRGLTRVIVKWPSHSKTKELSIYFIEKRKSKKLEGVQEFGNLL